MDRYDRLRGRYYFKSVILRLKLRGSTNEEIAEILGCSISTVKYCIRHSQEEQEAAADGLKEFGEVDDEFLRVVAVNKCKEFLTARGWQVGESDPKCVFDLFALKQGKIITIQVRGSTSLSNRNWPEFGLRRSHFNTKISTKEAFKKGSFDYWFFCHKNGDCWMIPFHVIANVSLISMEGLDQYYVANDGYDENNPA